MKLSYKIYSWLVLLFVGSASLQAQDDPFPDVSFRLYQGNMTITAQVVQNGQVVTDAIVAVYCEETIRGKKKVGLGTNPQLAYLTVYGNTTLEAQQLHFKVYTSGTIFTYTPSAAVVYKNNSSIGTDEAPYIITLPVSLDDNADNTETLKTYKDTECDVVLTGRTLYKDGAWNTLCLPFALSAAQIAAHADFNGATLMELDTDGKNGFDPTNGTLYLTFKEATEIAAGVPYLVKWGEDGDDFNSPVFSGVTIDAPASTTVSDADDGLQEVQMVGCYSPVPVVADDKSILFLGEANTLYYSTIDQDIRSCRACFLVPYIKQNAGAKACTFCLDFGEGEANGLHSIDNGKLIIDNEAGAWYDLSGRRITINLSARQLVRSSTLPKGLYIHGNRKVVNK